MIVTVTPNPGIDHTVRVPGFHLDGTIRAIESAWGMGGKATDVSWILGRLGVPTRALGFAAGPNGDRMEGMLRQRGVETDFVRVEGETRLNTVIVVDGEGQSTITASSLEVSTDHVSELFTRFEEALAGAACVVLGGSLPHGLAPSFYAEAIAAARGRGVPVLFDSSGPSLRAGLRAGPDAIKPNREEFAELIGYIPSSGDELGEAARRVRSEFKTNVIATLGANGAFAALETGSYFVTPPPVAVVSAAGSGDGVLAGLALAYYHGQPLAYGLQHGFALAGAILKTLATADFAVPDYEALLPQIQISPLPF